MDRPDLYISSLLSVSLCVVTMLKCVLGDPGYLPLKTDAESVLASTLQLARQGHMDDRHFCLTCFIPKSLRSKHCRVCDRCVAVFDQSVDNEDPCLNNVHECLVIVHGPTIASAPAIIEFSSSLSAPSGSAASCSHGHRQRA
jgi:hypothetical protein